MHCPHCALYSLWHQSGCSTVPLPSLATDLSNNTTRQRSSPHATGLSGRFEKDEDASYQQGSRNQSKDGFLLVGTSCPRIPSMPITDRGLLLLGRRTIKTGNVSWQQIKHLPTMDYGTDLLKAYENFIPHAKHYTGKTFTTK